MAPIDAHTLADSISSGLPRDRVKALRAVRNTGGAFVSIPDGAILEAILELARGCGVFAEPAAAATWAGLKAAFRTGLVSPSESAALLVTGNGLKDVRSVTRITGSPAVIDPTLDALLSLVKSNEKGYNSLGRKGRKDHLPATQGR
jgi:threonine synthase